MVAAQIGLKTPDTLISNNYEKVKSFIRKNRDLEMETIAKCFTPHFWENEDGTASQQNTSKVTESQLDPDSLRLSPLIFQPYINPLYEVRVTIIGDRIFSMKIADADFEHRSLPGDWRQFLGAKSILKSVHTLPQTITDKLRQLMVRFGLVFAAIDLIVDMQGDYVFLELNEAGQFLFCEQYCPGLPLLANFSALLLSGSRAINEKLLDNDISFEKFKKSDEFLNMPNKMSNSEKQFITET